MADRETSARRRVADDQAPGRQEGAAEEGSGRESLPDEEVPVREAGSAEEVPAREEGAAEEGANRPAEAGEKIRSTPQGAPGEKGSGSQRVADDEDARVALRALRPRLRSRHPGWRRTGGMAGEGAFGYQALLHPRRSGVRRDRRPGVVQGRGIGRAGTFHAVAQEL